MSSLNIFPDNRERMQHRDTMSIRKNYTFTLYACYVGYITQAIINNFAPLLFLTFRADYRLPLEQISLLVTLNFCTQLVVDLLSAKFVDRIGYRICVVAAHFFSATGLVCLGVLPGLLPDPYPGLCIAVILYAVGGGLIEVLVSPIVEACPTEGKSAAMSLLHSFYCWGSVLVILVSTGLFAWLGYGAWPKIACLWALVPFLNAFLFMRVPINTLVDAGESMSIPELLRSRLFWLFALLMLCSGASELSMSQWASAFAESGIHVSKTVGDLAGPCLFAVLMGCSRVFHSRFAETIDLYSYLGASALLCIASYLLASLAPSPLLSLAGCALCGISVGAMWPGAFSLSNRTCPRGGTAMFALLSLAGDAGCSLGPTTVGFVSAALGDNLKSGLLAALIFPLAMFAGIRYMRRNVQ